MLNVCVSYFMCLLNHKKASISAVGNKFRSQSGTALKKKNWFRRPVDLSLSTISKKNCASGLTIGSNTLYFYLGEGGKGTVISEIF